MATLLVDGHYALHRVLHVPAVRVLATKDGKPTGGVFSILKMIRATLYKFREVRRVVFVMDGGHSSRRLKLLSTYKQREPDDITDADGLTYIQKFAMQINYLRFLLPKLGIKFVILPGREGDDVLGLLAKRMDTTLSIVMSDDRDMLQLIDEKIHVWRPMAEERVTIVNFEEVAGCKLEHFLLRKAITGDHSDHVPGVPGVKDKTFAAMLEEAGDIGEYPYEKLFEFALSHHKARYRALGENFDIVTRNFELLDISREEISDAEFQQALGIVTASAKFDVFKVKEAFQAFELFSLIEDFSRWVVPFQTLT
jgi:DNA polymerase I